MRLRLTLIENEKLEHLGTIFVSADYMLPAVGDKFYYKGVQQYNVLERHFNIMEASLYDVELFFEKTKCCVQKLPEEVKKHE